MKKLNPQAAGLNMLKEYDFSKGVRGKYLKRYQIGVNVVVVDSDVCRV